MQTPLTVLIVLCAMAYVAWTWMPARWLNALRPGPSADAPAVGSSASRNACGACGSCGACPKR